MNALIVADVVCVQCLSASTGKVLHTYIVAKVIWVDEVAPSKFNDFLKNGRFFNISRNETA